jgi:hypothetical protein
MGADLVRHLKGIQRRIGGEEAALVGGDVQAGVGLITMLLALLKAAQHGIVNFAVHLDVPFAG